MITNAQEFRKFFAVNADNYNDFEASDKRRERRQALAKFFYTHKQKSLELDGIIFHKIDAKYHLPDGWYCPVTHILRVEDKFYSIEDDYASWRDKGYLSEAFHDSDSIKEVRPVTKTIVTFEA